MLAHPVTNVGAQLSYKMKKQIATGDMQTKAEIFAELRPVLLKLAQRILGSEAEAEDMVQDAFLRWAQSNASEVRSPKSFLATVVTRLCLNHLALARVRLVHEDASLLLENLSSAARGPAEHAGLADAVSAAFTTVLGNLSPTGRAVFLLREAFELDYGDIASVVERSEENCRQILSRARERIAANGFTASPALEQDRRVVSEFLNAAETGELNRLRELLAEGAALAPAPADLSQPAPPLIYDREILFQTLRNALGQMRHVSDDFVVLPIGRDYACVARSGGTAKAAVLLCVNDQKVAAVRLVRCPVLLRDLQILMTVSSSEADGPGNTPHNN
jgi:RNA polymerase sigma-70 factor (ECF subfamily)